MRARFLPLAGASVVRAGGIPPKHLAFVLRQASQELTGFGSSVKRISGYTNPLTRALVDTAE
jgi:hypothetical protein